MAATINLSSFPFSHQLNCPHCQTQLTLYDPSGSEYVVCPNCRSYCKVINGGSPHVQGDVPAVESDPLLPLGTEGTLKGLSYKVIGYLEKKEAGTSYEYKWKEYMLYNFKIGYAFLAEYEGCWNFIAGKQLYPQLATAKEASGTATMDGGDYALFNRYTPIITGLLGEYDWDVYEERVLTSEYISPPFMLVKEKSKAAGGSVDWYLGEYIEDTEIAEGFKINIENFPDAEDVGATEPNPYELRFAHSIKISIATSALLILIQILFSVFKPQQVILNKTVALALPPPPVTDTSKAAQAQNVANNFYLPSNNGNYEYQSLKTSSFNIFRGPASIEIEFTAPIDNTWLEATFELVSEKDNQTWDVTKEIEYYHGYEDGESWSEGSNSESLLLANIPAGNYHLNVYPYGGSNAIEQLDIKVAANITLWQNILLTILALCLYPVYCWYRKRQFEVNRWMGNDYSPFKTISTNE
jgi:hypothetical protein